MCKEWYFYVSFFVYGALSLVKSNKTSDLTMEVDLYLDPSFLEVLEYGTFLPLLTPFIR